MKHKSICPKCKSKNVIPIAYGMPAQAPDEWLEDGVFRWDKVIVRHKGCVIGKARYYCRSCGREW
jgi:transposase-like protein